MSRFQQLALTVGAFVLGAMMTLPIAFQSFESFEAQEKAELLPKLKKSDPLPANLFVELSKAVNPAIVNINTTQLPRGGGLRGGGRPPGRDPMMDMFEQFMGPGMMMQQPQRPIQSLGTGFIIRDDGLIITNNHVVDQADVIKVQIDEKSKDLFDAEIIGKDDKTDIALIKIKSKKKLPVAHLGSSADLEVGEWVAAFGNPYGHGHTMTKGIVSAIGREINEINVFPFIQTDASINPGNSGGPLVNVRGEVIGVNTAIDQRAQGIGFAIPIDNVKSILSQLEKDGSVKRGFLGVYMADIDDEQAQSLGLKQKAGALVTQVIEGSPAELAGIQPYDLIVDFNGRAIGSTADLSKTVATTPVGQQLTVKVIRNGKELGLKLKIGQQSDERKVSKRHTPKVPKGESAPHNYGFNVVEFNRQLADSLELPPMKEPRPIVVEVTPNSPASRAGLAPGDVIVDVNRQPVVRPKDVFQLLRAGSINVLKVLKRDRPVLIYLR